MSWRGFRKHGPIVRFYGSGTKRCPGLAGCEKMEDMSENPDKIHKELLESIRKMLGDKPAVPPEPDQAGSGPEEERHTRREEHLRFDLKPKQVKKYLDRFVIQQEAAKRVLATAVCDHYNHVRSCRSSQGCRSYAKQNVIMLGPTGIGKTHLVRHLAELVGVPFVKADATKFSETGYVGGDVEDLIRDLVKRAEDDLELAQYGMVYLDEIDKIAGNASVGGRDVSGSGVQRGLLKIMEETEVPLRNPQDIQSQFQSLMEMQKGGKAKKPTINTRHILFIVSGSFDGLVPIIERRHKDARIGFSGHRLPAAETQTDVLSRVETRDFIEFGLESEFIGRLPVRVVCHPLDEEALYQILTRSEDSILRQYSAAFEAYGIRMHIDDKALWEIAKLAAREKTGARGLFTVCERVFRDLKYELPSSRLREFRLTADMVDAPYAALGELLKEERQEQKQAIAAEIRHFEKAFHEANGIRLAFSPDAVAAVQEKIVREDEETRKYLEQIFSNYRYGLDLIRQKTGKDQFTIERAAIENPNAFLDRWIKETYE